MGFFGGKKKEVAENSKEVAAVPSKPALETAPAPKADVNAALIAQTSVFEFGSAGSGNDDGVTLAGYCPVSDEMEPCRWEILPSAGGNEAPKFRIIF